MKHWKTYIALILFIATFSSCSKNSEGVSAETFYGKWATNYGDTISFFSSGTNQSITFKDYFVSPRVEKTQVFTYQNNRLGIKNWLLGPVDDYKFFETFIWIQEGQVFDISSLEWHPFRSSSLGAYRFTKIR
jgi:hypothetical protein